MLAKEYLKQINELTSLMIGHSLSVAQNYPALNENTGILYIAGEDLNLSIPQKNISFKEIYEVLDNESNYNIKLIDGGLVQFNYFFDLKKDMLLKHRLAYFPSPYLETFQNESEIYELDVLYADVIKKNILPVPVRFDYDPKVNEGKDNVEFESIHPHSHVTFGQYENCRIAVSNFVSPIIFMEFILKSFYGRFYYDTIFKKNNIFEKHHTIEKCISDFETKSLHLSINF
ncbi:DUF2290 domain-containing protein [Sphingobacterium zeae]|uniref:DUF2290 domain-containing protein n=1 Tax=Sphingobacterium zeae TaxID=1776859 RepID=UPI00360DDA37